MLSDKNILWIFTFEYAGIVKFGGLGEVPANQAKQLVESFNVTVFLPSHGQLERLKQSLEYKKLSFTCIGLINPSDFGSMGPESSYCISFYKFKIDKVNVIILSGENTFTAKFLDDKTVYNPDTIRGKICLFSLGIKCLIQYLIDKNRKKLPNVIHLHDYHVVLPFISIKQALTKNGYDVASIITIHLLTWPRFDLNFYKVCGIDNTPIKVRLLSGLKALTLTEIFTLDNTIEKTPSVEKIGAIICDMVTTVSESYLISDIIPNCGQNLIEFKSDFVWDGCDWEYDKILNNVIQTLGNEIYDVLNIPYDTVIKREDFKKFLLKYKIEHLSESPFISSQKVLQTINDISDGITFFKNGEIKAFSEIGPLMITTGRISPQKGFDTIFFSLPEIFKAVPDAKFLFLILPTDYSLNEIRLYADYAKKYPENIKIIFGVAPDIFYLAHIAADVYCALSRWEPFGIMALEAMATKIPIIASKVGGLQETIIDMRMYPEIGTGILIEKENSPQFANALISLFKAADVARRVKDSETHTIYDAEILKVVNQIPDEIIKSRVLLNPNYYNIIRENCIKRVKNHFTWKIVSKKLITLYAEIQKIHFINQ
ncbi:MAG: glycogen/starch synthase [Candidatus Hodarchaeota archaeon]